MTYVGNDYLSASFSTVVEVSYGTVPSVKDISDIITSYFPCTNKENMIEKFIFMGPDGTPQ